MKPIWEEMEEDEEELKPRKLFNDDISWNGLYLHTTRDATYFYSQVTINFRNSESQPGAMSVVGTNLGVVILKKTEKDKLLSN